MFIILAITIAILLLFYMLFENEALFIISNLAFIPAVIVLLLPILNNNIDNIYLVTMRVCLLIEFYLHFLYYRTDKKIFSTLGDYAIGGLYTTAILYYIA